MYTFLRITLLVTGAAYIIRIIRDFVTLTWELAMVGMVLKWIVPRPRSRCLTSLARSGECQRWSNVEVWWPNNWVSAQSVVAINVCCLWWLSQIWGLLMASLPPRGIFSQGQAAVPALWRHNTRSCACMNAPLGYSVASVSDFGLVPRRLSTHLAPH